MTQNLNMFFARASLVLACIAVYLSHTKYTKFTKYGESLRPRWPSRMVNASGVMRYLCKSVIIL